MDQVSKQLRAHVTALWHALAARVPPGLAKDMDKAYVAARSSVGSAASAASGMAVRAREGAFQQANAVTAAARPYTAAAARQLEPHARPVVKLAQKHVQPVWKSAERDFEKATRGTPKLQVAATAAVICLLAFLLVRALLSWLLAKPKATLAQRTTRSLQALPMVKERVAKATSAAITVATEGVRRKDPAAAPLLTLPPAGVDMDAVMLELEERAGNDFRYADGESRATGSIYMAGDAHRDLLNDAYAMFSQSNPLHVALFPSVRRCEAEVLSMTADLLGGGAAGVSTVCGAMTSGGSESIVSAMFASLAYQGAARGISAPEVIIADSAHAAYRKGAAYAGAKLIVIPADPKTYRLTAAMVRPHLSSRTALVVASAPTFPHGVVDDVAGIAALCKARRVCLHVDACLGGFVLPFMSRLGRNVPPFDFGVEGVTSMSVDTHKYGQAHKGTSVVLYRTPELRRAQFTAVTDWSGGLYISPGLSGSRSGALIATAWAAMRHNGQQGYQDATAAICKAVDAFVACVADVPELEVMGQPASSVVAFKSRSRTFSIHHLGEILASKGWDYAFLIKPAALHFCFTLQHAGALPAMTDDLRAAAAELRDTPPAQRKAGDKARLYGSAASAAAADATEAVLMGYQDAVLSPVV